MEALVVIVSIVFMVTMVMMTVIRGLKLLLSMTIQRLIIEVVRLILNWTIQDEIDSKKFIVIEVFMKHVQKGKGRFYLFLTKLFMQTFKSQSLFIFMLLINHLLIR